MAERRKLATVILFEREKKNRCESIYDSKETSTEKYYINGTSEHDVFTVLQKCAVWEIYTVVFTSLGTPGKITY